jgi:hypothetical protein
LSVAGFVVIGVLDSLLEADAEADVEADADAAAAPAANAAAAPSSFFLRLILSSTPLHISGQSVLPTPNFSSQRDKHVDCAWHTLLAANIKMTVIRYFKGTLLYLAKGVPN